MSRILRQIAKRWGDLGERMIRCQSATSAKAVALSTIGLMCGVFIGTYLLSIVSGCMALHVPRLCVSALLISLILPVFVILAGTVRRNVNLEVWIAGFSSSIVLLMLGLGLGVFCSGVTILPDAVRRRLFSGATRFPLSEPRGIAVDSKGTVYVAIRGYGRIQAYSETGSFLKGWFVKTGGGPFDIWIGDDGLLHAVTATSNNHYVFDFDGRLLRRARVRCFAEYEHLHDTAGGLEERDAGGNSYFIQSPIWCPKVLKVHPNGQRSVLIKDPYYLWVARAPVPAFPLFGAGVLMCGLLSSFTKKKVDFTRVAGALGEAGGSSAGTATD